MKTMTIRRHKPSVTFRMSDLNDLVSMISSSTDDPKRRLEITIGFQDTKITATSFDDLCKRIDALPDRLDTLEIELYADNDRYVSIDGSYDSISIDIKGCDEEWVSEMDSKISSFLKKHRSWHPEGNVYIFVMAFCFGSAAVHSAFHLERFSDVRIFHAISFTLYVTLAVIFLFSTRFLIWTYIQQGAFPGRVEGVMRIFAPAPRVDIQIRDRHLFERAKLVMPVLVCILTVVATVFFLIS